MSTEQKGGRKGKNSNLLEFNLPSTQVPEGTEQGIRSRTERFLHICFLKKKSAAPMSPEFDQLHRGGQGSPTERGPLLDILLASALL